jgi:hypothetical protein
VIPAAVRILPISPNTSRNADEENSQQTIIAGIGILDLTHSILASLTSSVVNTNKIVRSTRKPKNCKKIIMENENYN